MVGDLVDGGGHDGVEDTQVPGPQLVQLVAVSVGGDPVPQGRDEPSPSRLGVHFVELPIEVASDDDLSGLVLLDDVLGQLDNRFRPLADEVLEAGFEVDVEDMHFLTSYWNLGPVQVCTQGLDLPVASEVAEVDAPSRALQQGLVAVVPTEEQG